jgi:hypothetical protein
MAVRAEAQVQGEPAEVRVCSAIAQLIQRQRGTKLQQVAVERQARCIGEDVRELGCGYIETGRELGQPVRRSRLTRKHALGRLDEVVPSAIQLRISSRFDQAQHVRSNDARMHRPGKRQHVSLDLTACPARPEGARVQRSAPSMETQE